MPVHGWKTHFGQARALTDQAWDVLATIVEETESAVEVPGGDANELLSRLNSRPPELPQEVSVLLEFIASAGALAANATGPLCFAHVPGSALYAAIVGDLMSSAMNRHTAFAGAAPAFAVMEKSILRWMADEFDLPSTASGVVTSGGSISALTAFAAARDNRLRNDFARGVAYVGEYAHASIAKALRIIGLGRDQIRLIPGDACGRLRVEALQQAIDDDLAHGRTPFLVVGTAGTTDTGAIDPLPELAALAQRYQMWFHVDGAYGGFFRLTERGRHALRGVESADSVVLDAHKSLFLPFGTGILLVRDESTLRDTYQVEGPYLRDHTNPYGLANRADLGPELTTEFRGLRLWLPLHLHGVAAFRETLDEKLDLAQAAYLQLSALPGLSTVAPDLSTFAFWAASDEATQRLLKEINHSGAGSVSSTVLDQRLVIRLCVLNVDTHAEHVDELVKVITRWVRSEL